MLESRLQEKCVQEAKERGILVFKTVAVGRRGYPDLTLHFRGGITVLVELKTPTGKLSALQARLIRELKDYGVCVRVIDNLEDFIELLEYYL